LLTLAYSGFVALGAEYGNVLKETAPESLLAAISGLALGPIAMPIVSATIMVSCLATATVLASLFSKFIAEDIFNNKISYHMAVGITMVSTYVMSLLGFQLIVSWIGLMLGWMYPLLIVYAIYKIYEGLKSKNAEPTMA
jgi:LIVCS family branched-chain amino acid:cation transporter